jgi:sigma-B regulation protein RsbU (phosphoserine phosphatase)
MTQTIKYNLQLVSGDAASERVLMNHFPFTLGRLEDRDWVVVDASVSRDHAAVVVEEEGCAIEDHVSRFGTFVNGEKIDRRKLRIGDIIQLGSLNGPKLRFGSNAEGSTATPLDADGQGQRTEFERLQWFLDAARRLNEFGAIDQILVSLLDTTLQLTKVERGFVFLKEADGPLRLAASRTKEGTVPEDDSTISHSAIQQAIKSASKFIVTDTLSAEAEQKSESMVVNSIRSIICIPLRRRSGADALSETMGVLYLDSRLHAGRLSVVEHDLLETIAKEAAALVENASLAKSEVAARKYRTELAIAAQIQQGLMKVQVPRLPYVNIAAQSIPCLEIGGDFYDVIESHGCLYVIIADISGKGISAALLASTLQGMLYALVQANLPLPEIAAVANQFIFNKNVGKYATMVMVRITADGVAEYMNCGHIKPLVVSDTSVLQLQDSNMVVGLLPNIAYESTTHQLKKGERIILVTDGVTEAENEAGDFYGDDALAAAVLLPTVDQILAEVQGFMGSAPSADDCTIVELRYSGNNVVAA